MDKRAQTATLATYHNNHQDLGKGLTMTTKQPTCAERIETHHKRTCATVRALLDSHYEGEDYCEAEQSSLHEHGLSLEWQVVTNEYGTKRPALVWMLSWGGPSSEVQAHVSVDDLRASTAGWEHYVSEPRRVVYAFKDWFDGATCTAGEALDEAMRYWLEICPLTAEKAEELMDELYGEGEA